MFILKGERPPKDGQICLVKCSQWSTIGYETAVYRNGQFLIRGTNLPGHDFNESIESWMPIDENKINAASCKAEKWDNLDAQIGKAYDPHTEMALDLIWVGEIAASSFGYL